MCVSKVQNILSTLLYTHTHTHTMLSASPPLPLLQRINQLSQYDVILLTLPHAVQPSSNRTLAAVLLCTSDQDWKME